MSLNLNLDYILECWKSDSRIHEMALDEASANCPILHAKYLEMLSIAKLKYKKKQQDFNLLMKDKWLYFTGKMSKEDMDDRGWVYDPFGGIKVMKSDLEHFYNADDDLIKMEQQVEYLKTVVDTLMSILDSVKFRANTIKNMIEWRKFSAGA